MRDATETLPHSKAKTEHRDAAVAFRRADPTGLIQRTLGGFPVGFGSAEQVVLAWLMTLPASLDPPRAARSLLAARMPCCRAVPPPKAQAVRTLLRFVASHHKPRDA